MGTSLESSQPLWYEVVATHEPAQSGLEASCIDQAEGFTISGIKEIVKERLGERMQHYSAARLRIKPKSKEDGWELTDTSLDEDFDGSLSALIAGLNISKDNPLLVELPREPEQPDGDTDDIDIERPVFHEGERLFQEMRGKFVHQSAQKLGEHKMEDSVPPEIVGYIEHRHTVYVASVSPDVSEGELHPQVWSSVIYADPADDIPATHEIPPEGPHSLPPKPQRDLAHYPIPDDRDEEEEVPPEAPFCKPHDPCSITAASANLTSPFQAHAYKPLVEMPDSKTIRILKPPIKGDPLWENAARPGAVISLNFLEFETRKRYRTNGVVLEPVSDKGFAISVKEAFSTCQRYIQRRTITGIHDHPSDPVLRTSGPEPELSPDLVEFVTSADTMLIATAHPQKGADSSHRGGRPGFVRVIDNRKLVWGDYKGKDMFQTFGNTVALPKAGVLFVDFERGHTLQVMGRLSIDWVGQNESLDDTDRLAVLRIEQWRFTEYASPFQWKFLDYSSFNPLLSDRPDLLAKYSKKGLDGVTSAADTWRAAGESETFEVVLSAITLEADDIKTYKFHATRDKFSYEPGQYACFALDVGGKRYVRSWTISSAHLVSLRASGVTADTNATSDFDITVKKEPHGATSTWLYDQAKEGDRLKCLGFEGQFTLDASERILTSMRERKDQPEREWWKIVLIAGGIGITPMMAHLRGLYNTRAAGFLKQDRFPDVWMVLSAKTAASIAFKGELHKLSGAGGEAPVCHLAVGLSHEKPFDELQEGDDKAGKEIMDSINPKAALKFGHIDSKFLGKTIPDIGQRVAHLCGPSPFMGAMVDQLKKAGMDPRHIITEAFD